jgi:hypothetical protein
MGNTEACACVVLPWSAGLCQLDECKHMHVTVQLQLGVHCTRKYLCEPLT